MAFGKKTSENIEIQFVHEVSWCKQQIYQRERGIRVVKSKAITV